MLVFKNSIPLKVVGGAWYHVSLNWKKECIYIIKYIR